MSTAHPLVGAGLFVVLGGGPVAALDAATSLAAGLLSRPPAFLGVLASLLGAGSIGAGLTSARVLRRHDERHLAPLDLLAGVAGYLLIATGWLPSVAVGQVVSGFHLPWVVTAAVTAGQRLTPDHLQGRVAAAITLLLFAAQPLTQAGGAALITVLDHRAVYLLVAGLGLVLAAALSRSTTAPSATRASEPPGRRLRATGSQRSRRARSTRSSVSCAPAPAWGATRGRCSSSSTSQSSSSNAATIEGQM